MNDRFFLDQDNSSHWYVVAESKRFEWGEWLALPEDDEQSWEVPVFASAVGGSPSQVTFTNPKV